MSAREQHVSRMQLDVKDEGDLGFSVRTADHPFVGGVGCGDASAGLSVHAGDMRGDSSIRRMGSPDVRSAFDDLAPRGQLRIVEKAS